MPSSASAAFARGHDDAMWTTRQKMLGGTGDADAGPARHVAALPGAPVLACSPPKPRRLQLTGHLRQTRCLPYKRACRGARSTTCSSSSLRPERACTASLCLAEAAHARRMLQHATTTAAKHSHLFVHVYGHVVFHECFTPNHEKERIHHKPLAYLELARGGPQTLVVLGSEVGGRWNAQARRVAATAGWARHWWSMLSVAVQQAVASTALDGAGCSRCSRRPARARCSTASSTMPPQRATAACPCGPSEGVRRGGCSWAQRRLR